MRRRPRPRRFLARAPGSVIVESPQRLTIIGGGLAGCEAAWQAARCGVEVELFEMRPGRSGPAHGTGTLAELVCSNSLRGAALENAVGLLKEELARIGSLIVACARETAVPAGSALAVDRARFSQLVESRISSEPRITLRREEVRAIPRDRPVVVACGPLPSDEFLADLDAVLSSVQPESGRLHYYDAASPIVAAESIDESKMYRKSRYDKGNGDDYLNIPLDREQYAQLLRDLRTLERYSAKEFEETRFFEGCLPVEVMADRGEDALRFGPLKPVGLRDPRTGRTPHAVVQLRKENVEGTAYNLVGFQTRLAWPAQREALGKLPGLEGAEWLRLGVMHRNTFIDSPRLLDARLKLRGSGATYFAGQITGSEGYVEAAACGAMTGIHASREILGLTPVEFPRETAFGAVVAHLQNQATPDFQPSNVTWAPFVAPEGAGKRERRQIMAQRALSAIDALIAETLVSPAG
ncbi:MAG TPA: methylenetetrahydrofolate--tRNA-(uracil(54)-C(5))-methyltransferase (FADH(2)-oxidizing) TrmFO [Candidatus Baltobacteraceae bacterium]|nr:methylenetetrahydrofolate--tRNA-(uracil(54)-C(5))-methyltransferase (FADH(2)-oxidizing) TrmFO [Candidatus Baltobacteraceae bacterium]